jgi:subtilisin family serine protease
MRFHSTFSTRAAMTLAALWAAAGAPAPADPLVASETGSAAVAAKYGVTGKGVIFAMIDRGIDYTHPDFRNADGTTRIKAMLDMTGQNLCAAQNPAPVQYSEAAINAALKSGKPLAERDAVGHGTVGAGLAAGNGLAYAGGAYAGLAPQADLLIVKVLSEGAAAHGTQPAEAAFQGCYSQALDWIAAEAKALREPVVALIDSGTQWGPMDGTSAVSRKIDADFGSANPGKLYVAASGDEGSLPNHGRVAFKRGAPGVLALTLTSTSIYMSAWYTGAAPATVTVRTSNGTTASAAPGGYATANGIAMYQYAPGAAFYPWQSAGPDRAVWLNIAGHPGKVTLTFATTAKTGGVADVYGDEAGDAVFNTGLTTGRLNDYSTTKSALVDGCYNVRTSWKDLAGVPQFLTTQGATDALWTFSSGGPTRDGRVPPSGGVDVTTPGGNSFAAYARNSVFGEYAANYIYGGGGYYGRQSATSASAPIMAGAAALLLQMNPALTGAQVKALVHASARHDAFTGSIPNVNWGYGKLDLATAADAIARAIPASPSLLPDALVFAAQKVGTTSAAKTVTLKNKGTAALTVTSIAASGDFQLKSDACPYRLAAGASCAVSITFHPLAKGAASGTLTFKDINVHSPEGVALSGTGK